MKLSAVALLVLCAALVAVAADPPKPPADLTQDIPATAPAWTSDPKLADQLGGEAFVEGLSFQPPRSFECVERRSSPARAVFRVRKDAAAGKDASIEITFPPSKDAAQRRPWFFDPADGATPGSLFAIPAPGAKPTHGRINNVPVTHAVWRNKADAARAMYIDFVALDGKRWMHFRGTCSDNDTYYLLQASARTMRLVPPATDAELQKRLAPAIALGDYVMAYPLADLTLDLVASKENESLEWSDNGVQSMVVSVRKRPHLRHDKPKVLDHNPQGFTEGPVWMVPHGRVDELKIGDIPFTRAVREDAIAGTYVLYIAYDGAMMVQMRATLRGDPRAIVRLMEKAAKTIRKGTPEEKTKGVEAFRRVIADATARAEASRKVQADAAAHAERVKEAAAAAAAAAAEKQNAAAHAAAVASADLRAKRVRTAAETIRDAGGWTDGESVENVDLTRAKQFDAAWQALLATQEPVATLTLPGDRISDAVARDLAALPAIKTLHVTFTTPDAPALARLAKLPVELRLQLEGKDFTDATLEPVGRIEKLSTLMLNSPKFTDAGLAHLRHAPSLQHVFFESSSLTGEGLKHLAGCPKLGVVTFNNAPALTDAGVAYTRDLPHLTHLSIFTARGVTDAALPALDLHPTLTTATFGETKVTPAAAGKIKGPKGQLTVTVRQR